MTPLQIVRSRIRERLEGIRNGFSFGTRRTGVLQIWQIGASFGRDWHTYERGWKVVQLWALKFIEAPDQGEQFSRRHYKGLYIRFAIWLPIDSA